LFQIADGQRCYRIPVGHPDVYAVLSLAMGARVASRNVWRSGSARNGRCLDVDGAGVLGIVALEEVCVSTGTQSDGAVCDRAAFFVRGEAAFSVGKSEQAPTLVGVLDESCNFRNGDRVEPLLRDQSLSDHPVDRYDGRRHCRFMAVLRAASVRRGLLGASR